jgi:ParB family protein of integrating conjugative element (PFGI_1 class)
MTSIRKLMNSKTKAQQPLPMKPSEMILRRQSAGNLPHLTPKEVSERLQPSAVIERLTSSGVNNASHVDRDSEFEGSAMQLPVMSIKTYDKNPRRKLNTEMESIKASIRERGGLTTPFRVTRRGPGEPYMVAEGGNSRLAALQALFQEGDSRFQFVMVTYTKWRGDADAIVAHLIENETRGSMSFWDRANGINDFKNELELLRGISVSFRQLETELRKHGLVVGLANISAYKFAIERLAIIGEKLHIRAARTIQPHINGLLRLGQRLGLAEADIWMRCFNPTLADHAANDTELIAEQLCAELSASLKTLRDFTPEQLLRMLDWLERNPDTDCEQLEAIAQHAPASRPITSPRARNEGGDQPLPTADSGEAAPAYDVDLATRQGTETEEANQLSPVESIAQMVSRFADITSTRDCLVEEQAMPFSYYVEAPTDPIDATPGQDMILRYAGWWFLASLSGQTVREIAHNMPTSSRWRRTLMMDGGLDESAFVSMVEDDLLGLARAIKPYIDPIALLQLLTRSETKRLALALLDRCSDVLGLGEPS